MTAQTKHKLANPMDRRDFVKGAAGLTFAFSLGGGLLGRSAQVLAADSSRLNAWITIGTDNAVTLLCPSAEMGQGVWTSLPLVLAEELDADWSKVKVEYAPPIPPIYGNPHPVFHGAQVTAYSTSVSGYFNSLRIAGAQARKVLIDNAAAQWKVPAAELTTADGFVIHAKSGKRISYGDIAKFATVPAEPPKITTADLKKPSQFKLIGHTNVRRLDLPGKINGSAQYGIDVIDVPGTVYAAVLQAPAEGAKAAVSNLDDVAKMKDIAAVIPLPFGVAVIGGSVEATRAGRNALKVTWDMAESPAKGFDSAKAMEDYASTAKDPKAPARVAYKVGPTKEILLGAKVVEANYSSQYVYHAQMEPMNAVAMVAEDGKSAEIWTGTQFAALISFIVSGILKTTPDKIVVHQKFLGGGYGRRLGPDIAIQAVILASIVKKPVKLILTREDDLAAARTRPMTYHTLKAGLDSSNNLIAWYHRLVSENVDAVANPPAFEASGGDDIIGWEGMEPTSYDILSVLAEGVRKQNGVRVWPWRAIGTGYNKFAAEAFLDEVAQAMGRDPLSLRLELTKSHPRANAVIKAVAEMSDFAKKQPDRGKGIAFCNYDGTYTACVAEASVDKQTGKISVHNLWMAVDPGIVVQPDQIHAQLESGMVYGLSAALIEQLAFKDGAPQATNFDSYPVLRLADMPEIHTKIVASDAAPTGIGEVAVPTVAPAVANAIGQLTGKRLRDLPMSPDRVKPSLG
jgi:isoquinoline 1-oxidoreductase subunit beta